MGIVKLEEEKGKIKPIPLYEKIIFDFQVKKTFPGQSLDRIQIATK